MIDTARVRQAFTEQAAYCHSLESPFTERLCRVIGAHVDVGSTVGRAILEWQGNPAALGDSVPLRVAGALHALARAQQPLSEMYPPRDLPDEERLWEAVRAAFVTHQELFLKYLAVAPQTNEVGRAAPLMLGLLHLARNWRGPFALYEIGASAGLNMLLDRYRYDFGGAHWGDSRLLLRPAWDGPRPEVGVHVEIAARYGCDISPINIASLEERDRLISYVWPDQLERLSRLETAIGIASEDPPYVERREAAEWVEAHITPQANRGAATVAMHSIVWNYLPVESRTRINEHLRGCGAAATTSAPLMWLRYELEPGTGAAELRVTTWPGEADVLLARGKPHGNAIHFLNG